MNLYIRLQLKVTQAEIDGATNGVTFMKLVDGGTGHFVGLSYNHATEKFNVFSDAGHNIVIPVKLIDAYIGFLINAEVQPGNLVKITAYNQNVNYGNFVTPTPWNFDLFLLGAMDNPSGELVDHYYKGVQIGSTPGGRDVFDTDNFAAGTLVPPFESLAGDAFFDIVTNQLRVHSAGGTNAYARKVIRAIVVIPPPHIGWLNEPGDSTIIFAGYSDWAMAGQPAWSLDHWGMDKLVVSVRGSRRTRDDFLNTLRPWMAFPGEPNMFLADITQEQRGTSNFPQIDLVFIGKRGGVLPPDREQQGEQIQQISGRAWWNVNHTAGLWFISTTSEKTIYSRSPIDLSLVEPVEPAALDLMWFTETDVAIWTGQWETYQAIIDINASLCFVARNVSTGNSETLVPGQYYRATRIRQRLLFPVIG